MVYNDGMEESRFELSNLTPTPTPTPQLFIISDLHPGIYRSDRAAAAAGECIGDYTEQNLTIAVLRLRALAGGNIGSYGNIGCGTSTLAIRMGGSEWVAKIDEDGLVTWPDGTPDPIDAEPEPVTWETIQRASETVWDGHNLVTPTGYSEAMGALGMQEVQASDAWTVRRDGGGDAVYAECNDGFYEVYCENGGEFWCDGLRDHREFIDLEWIAHSPLTIECDLTENNEYGIPYRNIAYAVSADDLPAFIADILAKVEAAREAE